MPTTLPLANGVLAGYNNLPAIPRDDPLGDIINQLFTATSGSIARLLVVAPSGGQYTSIKSALAAAAILVPAPSVTNPAVIKVAPATYSENNPLVVPEGVFIDTYEAVGFGGGTVVQGQNATSAVFELTGNQCGIGGMCVSKATGAGGIGVRVNTPLATDSVFMQRLFVTECETGLSMEQGQCVTLESRILKTTATMQTSVRATGGQLLIGLSEVGGTPSFIVPVAFNIVGGAGRAATANAQYATDAWLLTASANFRVAGGSVAECVNAFNVADSTFRGDAIQIEERVTVARGKDLVVTGTTSNVFWTGGQLHADGINISAVTTTVMAAPMIREGGIDPSFSIVGGELSVGTEMLGRESAFGGGDSHQRGLAVMTNTNLEVGTWSDDSLDWQDPTTTTDLFPGVAAGNTWYIGGEKAFPNAKFNLDAAIVIVVGSIVFEYWNGAAWVAFDQMSTQADSPYNAYGNAAFERASQNEQYRFDDITNAAWVTKTLNSITKFWVRVRVATAITTSPSGSFVKLGTHRAEINADGFMEFFGNAEPRRGIFVHQKLHDDLAGASPSNGSIDIAAGITITPIDNRFNNGAIDGIGEIIPLPEGLDTSQVVTFEVLYSVDDNTAGDVELEFKFSLFREGSLLDGSAVPFITAQVDSVPINQQDIARSLIFELAPATALPDNFVGFSLQRDATAGNPNDTYGDNIRIISLRAFGKFWR